MSAPTSVPIFFAGSAMGIAVAILVAFFLNRFTEFNVRILGSVISVIAGGVVTAFLGIEKVSSWVGYCLGLGFALVFLVGIGKLDIGPPLQKASRLSQPPDVEQAGTSRLYQPPDVEQTGTSVARDPRLQMLDELHERHKRGALLDDDYWKMKRAISSDIEKSPAVITENRERTPT